MQDPEDIFKTRCKMALCLIVLLVTCSQGLIQYTLHGQEEVGEIINIAGRQRMYSQAIVKEAQFIYYARDIRTHNKHTEALQEVLDRWQTAHAVVVTYRVEEIFDANAQELDGMYAVLQTHHEAMQQAADSLRLARFRPGVTARPVIDTALSHLLAAEGPYLAQMEMIVGHYARAAKSEIRAIQQLGAGVLGITIVFLFFAGWFVSRPVKRTQGVLPLDLVAKGPQSLVNVADVTKPDVDVPEPKEDNTAYDGILAAVANAVLVSKPDGTVAWANDAYYAMTGYAPDEIVGVHVRNLYPEDSLNFDTLWAAVLAGEHWHGEITSGREDGTFYTREETITPILDVEGQLKHVVSIKNDVSNRKRQEVRVMHGQKMESVGQLAAGIAHEINTPMQYVGDNTQFLMDALQDVFETNNALQKVLTLAKEHGQYPELIAEVENLLEEADITYLAEEIPASLHQTLEGVNQVSRLVKAMREFSQPVIAEKTMVDVNSALENTLTVTENEWGFVADLRRDMACELPHILGYPAELNQAFYHLITNAAHAVAEAMEEAGGEKGDITISTATEDNWCVVRIGDNGTGIPEAIRPRIFDPFFTTKSDGLGVGQGLSVVHAVVVEKHGGRISIDSMAGVGTTVTVRLPLVPEKQLLHTLH